MALSPSIFDQQAEFDPSADFEAFLKQVPAKWVIYLMADQAGQPVQLLCVRNLRASLKRRLGGNELIGPSKRVVYREIVRRVFWRRVDSAFEADAVYLEAARQVFPESYKSMVGLRPAWFIHVNPEAQFPRYAKTTDLSITAGQLIGPIEDKHAAARLIQLIEDAFDLCRYYNILIQAPQGKACAYKEMGKCPAPCDGSISMEQYRGMIQWSAETAVDAGPFVRDQQDRMQQAARELRFETAGKIKAYIEQVSQFGQGPFRHARRLEDFQFLSLQRGPWAGTAKAFLITPGRVEEIAGIAGLAKELSKPADLLRLTLQLAADSEAQLDEVGVERLGIVAHHLFAAKQSGTFLRLSEIDEKALARAYRDLLKQKGEEESEGEGVVKELQAAG